MTTGYINNRNKSGIVQVHIPQEAAHDHDEDYSAIDHDHDADYSAIDHTHDYSGVYSAIAHTHDYAATYAALVHTHDYSGVYSALGHTHDYSGTYSAITHDHSSGQIGTALLESGTGFEWGDNWADYGSGAVGLRVKRVGDLVFLFGLVARSVSTSSYTTIATLAEGYRPTLGYHYFGQVAYYNSAASIVRLEIGTNGIILLQNLLAYTISYLYLDGIVFPID